jgi:hypothetical protein
MADLQRLVMDVLANGRVEGQEIDRLRQALYADGKIDRCEADVLVEMHKRVQRPTGPSWQKFFYQAIKDHILNDGSIDTEETAWLREMLWQDGEIDDDERRFLRELRGEARQTCPEFEALCDECLSQPAPRKTSGGGHRASPPQDRRA